ncbi:hypothetical protein ANCCEY_06969 [Ancylostoma ceylanicum]|uniref:Uncharacterized protein n=1 Tax=Ancylostoma ceylanicum TaxID=53326 RepID=A0A0D6LPH2_9BILA|nr:hypothetical protein ANCCEY_06969 [Ancylostoma ceylanicum]
MISLSHLTELDKDILTQSWKIVSRLCKKSSMSLAEIDSSIILWREVSRNVLIPRKSYPPRFFAVLGASLHYNAYEDGARVEWAHSESKP